MSNLVTDNQKLQDSLAILQKDSSLAASSKTNFETLAKTENVFTVNLSSAIQTCGISDIPPVDNPCKSGPCESFLPEGESCLVNPDKAMDVFGGVLGVDPTKPMSVLEKAWNIFLSNYHVIRANEFAVKNNIDSENIFETSFDDKNKKGTSLQVLIYQPIYNSKGILIEEKKHIFKQHKAGVLLMTSSDNDELNLTWDNYWDGNGQPILNSGDLAEPILDVSFMLHVGGTSKIAAGVKIAGTASKTWSVYQFMTLTGKYVGLAVDFERRMLQHGVRIIGSPDEVIKLIPDKLTARGIEQLYIEAGRKAKELTQQINSINPKRTERYNLAIKQAKEFLQKYYPKELSDLIKELSK